MEVHEAHQGLVEWPRMDQEEVERGRKRQGIKNRKLMILLYDILMMCIKTKWSITFGTRILAREKELQCTTTTRENITTSG